MGTVAVFTPLGAYAQTQPVPVIGFLSSRSASDSARQARTFERGLADSGYISGQNCRTEFRWADGDYDKLPALAAELVHVPVTVLASVGGEQAAFAAKAATSIVPIVFASGEDPVEEGLVRSLRRPEGNVTGATFYTSLLGAKRLGILRELVPGAEPFGVLVNPLTPQGRKQTNDVQDAARDMAVRVVIANVGKPEDLDAAVTGLADQHVGAVMVAADPSFDVFRDRLIGLAARLKIPTLYHFRDFAAAGGLMSYGAIIDEVYRQVGIYVGRILGGAKPAELPVMQPSKFELVINVKTATALGFTVPPLLLARADEVIE